MEKILRLNAITKSFNKIYALNDVSLNVYKGKVMALLGENGAGKSTLIKIISGAYKKDSGEIFLNNKPVSFSNTNDSQKAGISVIHQELNLLPNLSVAENIYLGREFTNKLGFINWNLTYQKTAELLENLNLDISPKAIVNQLSLGQQQMVEIAKALSFDSKILIMDEPTDALTSKETEILFTIIKNLKRQGCGIVYISHRLQEIFNICDHITILRDGEFIEERSVSNTTEDQLIELMVGRKLTEQFPKKTLPQQDTVLKVVNLSNDKVKNISFNLKKGEILGFSGLMGSGRTELMKAIYGADSFSSGNIEFLGKSIKFKHPKAAIKNKISYISEDRKSDGLILNLSVGENMSLSSLYDLKNKFGHINSFKEKNYIKKYIKIFNIKTPSINQLVSKLSGGNQQKIAIAKGVMTNPIILILDEPTRGIDVGAKKEIYELISQLKKDGMSVILVSSDMPEIIGLSDRVIVMGQGQITGTFSGAELTQENLLAAALK